MAERGRALYKYISNTSNTVVSTAFGTLYSITGNFPAGAVVRVDAAHSFNQGVLDLNATSSNTIGRFGGSTTFGQGILFDPGMVVAVSSNASVTIEYE